jgi:hypothetical protein
LDESGELSVEGSLLEAFSVLVVSVFFVLLLGASVASASVFAESALLFFFVDGLVALSAAGLLVFADDLVEGDGEIAGTGDGFTVALAEGVMVAAADAVAAGVMVAPTLAVAAGVALAFVEAVTPVVVVGAVEVVPVVAVTPTLKLGVTP